MIRGLASLALLLNACSLAHNDLPNEPPTLQASRIICQSPDKAFPDTLASDADEICQVRRGGEVRFEVRGADEDDDPLVYHWTAFGAGSFRDTLAKAENSWFAPQDIASRVERFLVRVTIADRDCGLVPDQNDRERCLENSEEIVETFSIDVVQRPPSLTVITDTTASFGEETILIDAVGFDPDGDALEYTWEQLEGENALSTAQAPLRDEAGGQIGSQLTIFPLFPGDYLFRISINDGFETVEGDISVSVEPGPPLPETGMIALTSPTGRPYEIDIYEYPNLRGELPLQATFLQAVGLCAEQGKRICSPSEWQTACQGEGGLAYSSTDNPATYAGLEHFGARFCNTSNSSTRSIFIFRNSELSDQVAPSGSFRNCGGTTGVYDLTGNLGEWTAAPNAANDLDVSVMASNVLLDITCDRFGSAGTLTLGGANIYDPAVLEQLGDTLNAIVLQNLEQSLVGFRCCR